MNNNDEWVSGFVSLEPAMGVFRFFFFSLELIDWQMKCWQLDTNIENIRFLCMHNAFFRKTDAKEYVKILTSPWVSFWSPVCSPSSSESSSAELSAAVLLFDLSFGFTFVWKSTTTFKMSSAFSLFARLDSFEFYFYLFVLRLAKRIKAVQANA